MCICFSSKYNRWWTLFFHVHCFAAFLCLLSLFFFGRLVFDDLDKKQLIHLGIHIAIVASLLTLLSGNRCSVAPLYFFYFIGYHLLLSTNIGLEVYFFYTTPHHTNQSIPNSTPRFPNGQISPYVNMEEEAFYALILVVLIIQTYFTLVVYGSYRYLIDKNTQVHTLDSVEVKPNVKTEKWDKRFSTFRAVLSCIVKVLPNN